MEVKKYINLSKCTSWTQNNTACCRFLPTYLPLSIQELDQSHIGKFSFSSREAVHQVCCRYIVEKDQNSRPSLLSSQLMNWQSITNLQTALAAQVAQKNSLASALKLACVCYWAESQALDAEVSLTGN